MDIFEWIEGTNAPSCNWCGYPRCFECLAAHQRIRLAKTAAERSYELARSELGPQENNRPTPEELNVAYDRGYQEACYDYADDRARMQAEITRVSRMLNAGSTPNPMMLEQARMQGYVAGVNAGRAMHAGQPQGQPASAADMRKQVMESVLRECDVIGESNPNMKPAMNALRHRVKKIG